MSTFLALGGGKMRDAENEVGLNFALTKHGLHFAAWLFRRESFCNLTSWSALPFCFKICAKIFPSHHACRARLPNWARIFLRLNSSDIIDFSLCIYHIHVNETTWNFTNDPLNYSNNQTTSSRQNHWCQAFHLVCRHCIFSRQNVQTRD